MLELRQSTAKVIRVGSAMAIADGVTPVTTLTLGSADQAEMLKASGVATVDISGYTFAAVTGCDGYYNLSLTASGTDTLGEAVVVIQDASLSLPIEVRCMVVTQNYWDSKYGTDKLEVDAVQAAGESLSAMVELTGIPSATPSVVKALMLLYMRLRNLVTTTASVDDIHNDAGSSIAQAAVSDDGTTFTKGEYS